MKKKHSEIFKRALLNNAENIVLVHNHSSGDPVPSEVDIETPQRLVKAGELLGAPVLNHIILGDENNVSMRASGMM